jgi:uncharacterized small protein (DUF1192 family)
MSIRRRVVTAAAVGLGALASPLAAQQTYPQTLYWGAGLVDIPVAWVAPLSGDFALNYSAKTFEKGDQTITKINYNDQLNSQLTFSISVFGRVEAGVAFYSSNPEYGFFGQALVLNEEDYRGRPGGWFIPSIAFGFRGIGPYGQIDRFGIGYSLLPPDPGSPNYRHVADSIHEEFDVTPTVYGVGTKSFSLADIRSGWPDVNLSISIGYGNGLFSDDGELGDAYAKNSTGGLFGGLKVDFTPTPNTVLSLMAENNAWDYNVGASLDWRGMRAGLYWTELGSGSARAADNTSTERAARQIYNYSKFAFTLGLQSNIFALLKGDFLRTRVTQLERQREALLAEIQTRQQRIAALELEINRYEAQNLLELEQRRAAAEAELRAEREALQRLEDRLRRIEEQRPPPRRR